MQYNVIVKAEIRKAMPNPAAPDVNTSVGKLLSEIFANQIKIISEGVLKSSRDGRITLTFKGEDGREIRISFSKKEPSILSLTTGAPIFKGTSAIFLEEGKRHKCVGKGPAGEHLEFTVKTEKIDNRLLKSGKLILDYSIEVCGVRAESTYMNLNVIHDKTEEAQQNLT